jgi:hypothetical protein
MNTWNACTQRNETKAVVKSNAYRRSVWGGVIQDVRSHRFTLQCDTICMAFGLCSSIPIVIWRDYCLLVALWCRFHIELAKCLLFRFRSSDLVPKCERQKTLRTRRERSGAPHANLVYNRVVAWVVWKNLCFFVWMVLRHDLCLAFGITCLSALRSWYGQGPGLLAVITV